MKLKRCVFYGTFITAMGICIAAQANGIWQGISGVLLLYEKH
jgi:hypothetical protein